MKRLALFIVGMLLCLCLTVTALAESWVCPQCGTTNTFNFCENCASPKPVLEENVATAQNNQAPVSTADNYPLATYDNARSFVDDQINIMAYWCEEQKITVQFDDAPMAGMTVELFCYYYTPAYEIVIVSQTANGQDRTFAFDVQSGWSKDHVHVEVQYDMGYDWQILQAEPIYILQFKDFNMKIRRIEVAYSLDFTEKKCQKTVDVSSNAVLPGDRLTSLGLGADGSFKWAYLCGYSKKGTNNTDIHVTKDGSVSLAYTYENGVQKEFSEYNGDDLSYFQNYADNHIPCWKNGDSLWTKKQ